MGPSNSSIPEVSEEFEQSERIAVVSDSPIKKPEEKKIKETKVQSLEEQKQTIPQIKSSASFGSVFGQKSPAIVSNKLQETTTSPKATADLPKAPETAAPVVLQLAETTPAIRFG